MQITDLEKETKIPAIWRLGFRPFFLFGSTFALISVALWISLLSGVIHFTPYGGGFWWHVHEVIFGFVAAIIVGFLLTAVQTWTGHRGLSGMPLAILFGIWLLSRILLICAPDMSLWLYMLIDCSFLLSAAVFLALPIIRIKQYRNLFFIPMLCLFTLVNAQMHLAIYPEYGIDLKQVSYTATLLIAVLMSVMIGRVTPMFTANGTNTPRVKANWWLERTSISSLVLVFGLSFFMSVTNLPIELMGLFLIISGLLHALRCLRWRPWITFKVPLLWSLHGAITLMWLGLIYLGLHIYFQSQFISHAWHLLTIGGIGGLILAMIARVSLGHTGRPLQVGVLMQLAFSSIFISAIIRSVMPWFIPEFTLFLYQLSSYFWYAAFLLFIIDYAPKLISPRVDGRPG